MIPYKSSVGAALIWLLATIGSGAEPDAAPGYVLLRDRAVLRGTVEEEPGKVIVRYRGSEIRLSREKVACWADSLDGLYQYQLDRRRSFTVETHLDAARWCTRHGLWERAAAEIIAATRLRPQHVEVERAAAELRLARERASHDSSTSGAAAKSEASAGRVSAAEDGSAAAAASPAGTGWASELSEDALRDFNSRIQPLLVNRCGAAACHGSGAPATWVLHSDTLAGRRPSAETTRENMHEVLRWINREHPAASPLLVRALEPHGGSPEAPLTPHDQQAVANLRQWIHSLRQTAESGEGHSSPLAAGSAAQASASEPEVGQEGQPVRLPDVADPFDPELFNRRFHPESRTDLKTSNM